MLGVRRKLLVYNHDTRVQHHLHVSLGIRGFAHMNISGFS